MIQKYDPIIPGKYRVVYGIGSGRTKKDSLQIVIVDADSRYDAIKKVKAVSPLFQCVECERMEENVLHFWIVFIKLHSPGNIPKRT